MWFFTWVCSIGLHVGMIACMDVVTWSRMISRPGNPPQGKFNPCDISTLHHKLQLDKPAGQLSTVLVPTLFNNKIFPKCSIPKKHKRKIQVFKWFMQKLRMFMCQNWTTFTLLPEIKSDVLGTNRMIKNCNKTNKIFIYDANCLYFKLKNEVHT